MAIREASTAQSGVTAEALAAEQMRRGVHPGDPDVRPTAVAQPAGPTDLNGAFKGEQDGFGVVNPDTGKG